MGTPAIVYCLTRDRDLAAALDEGLGHALAFFYNDAARLHQAVALRAPEVVMIDTDALRPEYGDAGLGAIVEFLRGRVPSVRIAVRPREGAEQLVAAEAGTTVELVPHPTAGCIAAMAAICAGAAPSAR